MLLDSFYYPLHELFDSRSLMIRYKGTALP